jgi:hypothetical protein
MGGRQGAEKRVEALWPLIVSRYSTHHTDASNEILDNTIIINNIVFGLTNGQLVSAAVAFQYVLVSCIMTFFNKVQTAQFTI